MGQFVTIWALSFVSHQPIRTDNKVGERRIKSPHYAKLYDYNII